MMNLSDIPFHPKAKVLFENERFFVIDKPNGVLSHPNQKGDSSDSAAILAPYDFDGEFFKIGTWKVFLLHRIDKETSGCLLFAKDASSAKKIKAQFAEHKIYKEYIALVSNIVRKPTIWKDHLVKRAGKVLVDKRLKPNAVTKVNPLTQFSRFKMSLVRFIPGTGRTHQLRVQSSDRHGAILGDRQYGNFARNKEAKFRWNFDRMFLHAEILRFKDPANGKIIQIESPLPAELQSLLDTLEELR
jgi:RluA family pseudouridine synthase